VLSAKEEKQARLYASIASGSFAYMRRDLARKLEEWKEIIARLRINAQSACPAGGKYYYFEQPCYLKQFATNLKALEYLVNKLESERG
jgi:hypothetical protein